MTTKLNSFAWVLLVACVVFCGWRFGPWRLRLTLADGTTVDGERYRVVQGYKDSATSGWVVGIYIADADDRWFLRWSKQADLPWERVSVGSGSEGLVVTVATGKESFSVTRDQMSIDVPDGIGWTFDQGSTLSEMQTGLLHTTY